MSQGPTDYTYGGTDEVVLDPVDRSKNDPTPLNGYPLEVRPQSGWPGMLVAAGEVRYDTTTMRTVSGWLKGETAKLWSVPNDLASANAANFGPSSWVQANHLQEASDQVTSTVRSYTASALKNLDDAGRAIEEAALTWDAAEQTNARNVSAVGAQVGGSGAPGGPAPALAPSAAPGPAGAPGAGVVRPQDQQQQITRTLEATSYQRTYEQVVAEFAQLDPATISQAAVAWQGAAGRLGELANTLLPQAAEPLSAAWVARSSAAAQAQLQLAQATVAALADQCMQMAHAMDYSANYAAWYKANLPDAGSVGLKQVVATAAGSVVNPLLGTVAGAAVQNAQANQNATDHLVRFMTRYNEVLGGLLPAQVQSSLLTPTQVAQPNENELTPAPVGSTTAPSIPGGAGAAGPGGSGPGGTGSTVPAAGQLGPGSAGSAGAGSAGPGGAAAGSAVGGLGAVAPGGGAAGPGGAGASVPGLGSVGSGSPYAADSALAGAGPGAGIGGPGTASAGLGSGLVPGAGSGTAGLGSAFGAGTSGLGSGIGSGTAGLGSTGIGAGGLGTGIGAGGLGTGLAGRGAGGLGAGGMGTGRAGLGVGRSGLGAAGLAGEVGEGGPGTGATGRAVGTGAGGAGSGAAGRGGMMPMSGHGGPGDGDRERSTWLTEDEDVWGAGADVPPPLITG